MRGHMNVKYLSPLPDMSCNRDKGQLTK